MAEDKEAQYEAFHAQAYELACKMNPAVTSQAGGFANGMRVSLVAHEVADRMVRGLEWRPMEEAVTAAFKRYQRSGTMFRPPSSPKNSK